MHTTVDYRKSAAPAFDAVQDIKEYLGDRYDGIAAEIGKVTDSTKFNNLCGFFLGIEGFPVKAWYEHFHGQGTWTEPKPLEFVVVTQDEVLREMEG